MYAFYNMRVLVVHWQVWWYGTAQSNNARLLTLIPLEEG